jgi:hypothetical protein
MYERGDARCIIKMGETGLSKLGKSAGVQVVGKFRLEDWDTAIEAAAANPEWGKQVAFKP